jgi:hypothetical protein
MKEFLAEGAMVEEKTGGKRKGCDIRFDLLEPEFITAMAHIMSVGAKKYGDYNWQKGLSGANGGINHAIKHLMEYQANTPNDYGPRKMHLVQVAVNAMFEFYYDGQREAKKEMMDEKLGEIHKDRIISMHEDLYKALKMLFEAKKQFTPNTTNSDVDYLLYKYNMIAKPNIINPIEVK